MRILITGGNGFIGRALIRNLLNQDSTTIISIDNEKYSGSRNPIVHPRLFVIFGDTRELDVVLASHHVTPDDIDLIYHFGEYARIASSFEDVGDCLSSNLSGTLAVLEYCRQNDKRLIYSGSSSILGNNGNDQFLNPYSWSKAKNCELIRNYHQWFNLQFSIAYFYNVYGEEQNSVGKYATIIGRFETQYLNSQPLSVVAPGTQKRDFTYVGDIVDGLVLLKDGGHNKEYHLGTGISHSILDVANMFNWHYEIIPERLGERLQSLVVNRAAEIELGWQPKQRLDEYIDNFIKKHPK